jgi:hypothetical protein
MASLKKLLYVQILPTPTIGQWIAGLSVLGVIGLAYVYGAAVMFFQLPSYDFLDKAFGGAKAWQQRGTSTLPYLTAEEVKVAKQKEGITVDNADKTCDGFTLYAMTDGARATLIDMRGKVVHRWELPFSKAWPKETPHVEDPLADEQIHWFHCHLYPNGDLLAIYHADGDTPYGYGLVKVDKDSKLVWTYSNNVHHDVDVGEDGTICTVAQKVESEPPAGMKSLATPYLADFLIVLSPEGQELEKIPIAEAFANSPYALALTSDRKISTLSNAAALNGPPTGNPTPRPKAPPNQSDEKNDLLHTNGVKVVSRAFAAKFPLVKAGQVLLSLRSLDTIAALDRRTRSVAWAVQGLWRAQHDPEMLENGHLLVYDNLGSLKQTRIVEFDPRTNSYPWVYGKEDSTSFKTIFRGMKQRFPNGNTLIVDPDARRLFEVTHDKELVWENFCALPPELQGQRPRRHSINYARRYHADELVFLKGVTRPRP